MHLDPHTLVETVSFLLVTVSIRLATPRKLQGFSRLSLQSLYRYNGVTDVYHHAWLFDMTAEDSNLRSLACTRSALSKAELSPKPGVNFISYFFSNASATYVYIHAYIGVNPYLLFCISREKKKGHCGSGGGGALWSLSDRHYLHPHCMLEILSNKKLAGRLLYCPWQCNFPFSPSLTVHTCRQL